MPNKIHIGVVVVDGMCEVRVASVPPAGFTNVYTMPWSEVISKLADTDNFTLDVRPPRHEDEAAWIRNHR